jgi:hypothetical protein
LPGDPRAAEWAFQDTVSAFGVPVALRANERHLLERMRACCPPRSQPCASDAAPLTYSVLSQSDPEGDGRRFIGFAGARVFAESPHAETVCAEFESVVRFDVAVSATQWTFIHAGVVGWNGRAIVIPASSMHGKSRLVVALVQAGATYYSDEAVVLDTQGRVHPYRLAPSIRHDDGGRVERIAVDTAAADPPPIPIGLVVVTRYEPGAAWRPRRGTRGEAVTALFSHTIRARIAPAAVLPVLARAVEGAGMLEGSRGDAHQTAPRLLEELA